jgi:uncharacterized protein YjiS (DUF1127 family)
MFAIFNGERFTQPLYRPTGIVSRPETEDKSRVVAGNFLLPDRIPQETLWQLLRAGWGGFLSGVRAALREWRRRRNGRLELARLDERMLRDIGLTRVDADYEINKPFWRE